MYSIGGIKNPLSKSLALTLATLSAAAFLASPQDEGAVLLSFEQREGEQIAIRFWVPVGEVADLFPEGLSPAAARRTSLWRAPPPGSVDCFLVLRSGSYTFSEGGREVTEKNVRDGYWLLAADAPISINPGAADAYLLLEYYTSNDRMATAMREAGVDVKELSGEFESFLRADSQQMVEGTVEPESRGRFSYRLVTTDLRHYDTARSVFRAYFKAGEELRAFDVQHSDDFYMRAVAEVNPGDSSPLAGWQGWMQATDSPAIYQYNTRNPQIIRRFPKP